MTFKFDKNQFEEIVKTSAQMGATMFAVDQGLIKTKISKSEAYKRYSRKLVDSWIISGKIIPVKQGGRLLLDVKQMEGASCINRLYEKHINPQLTNE